MYQSLSHQLQELLRKKPEELSLREAQTLAIELGALAPWLLKPEVLEKARQAALRWGPNEQCLAAWRCPPPLPEGCGACWCVAIRKVSEYEALRPAFVLPLRWQQGEPPKDVCLPHNLDKIAESVRNILQSYEEIKSGDKWYLSLALNGPFSGEEVKLLQGDYASAWVPLAAGLLLAVSERPPDRNVWASGAWVEGSGIVSVDGLEEKIAAAREFDAKEFFLPAKNALERPADSSIAVHALEEGPLSPRRALKKYLSRLGVRATRQDASEERVKTYLSLDDPEERTQYYLDCLVDDLAAELRRQDLKLPDVSTPYCRFFFTIMSDSPELVILTHLVLRPKESLIVYSSGNQQDNYRKQAERVRSWLQQKGLHPELASFSDGDLHHLVSQLRDLLDRYANACDDMIPLVIDITPGTKLMTLALAAAAPPSARLLYVSAEFDSRIRKPRPFSERLSVFSKESLFGKESLGTPV